MLRGFSILPTMSGSSLTRSDFYGPFIYFTQVNPLSLSELLIGGGELDLIQQLANSDSFLGQLCFFFLGYFLVCLLMLSCLWFIVLLF